MARSSGDDNVVPKESLLDRSVAKSLSDRSVTRPVSCQSLPDSYILITNLSNLC